MLKVVPENQNDVAAVVRLATRVPVEEDGGLKSVIG